MTTKPESRKMPREVAIARLRGLKKASLVISVLGFFAFLGLAAEHVTGVTSRTGTSPTSVTQPAGTTPQQNSTNINAAPNPFFGGGSGSGVTQAPAAVNPYAQTRVS